MGEKESTSTINITVNHRWIELAFFCRSSNSLRDTASFDWLIDAVVGVWVVKFELKRLLCVVGLLDMNFVVVGLAALIGLTTDANGEASWPKPNCELGCSLQSNESVDNVLDELKLLDVCTLLWRDNELVFGEFWRKSLNRCE